MFFTTRCVEEERGNKACNFAPCQRNFAYKNWFTY